MTESQKKFTQQMLEKATQGCLKALKHSRVVADFQVMGKKDFDSGWGKTYSSGCVGGWKDVRKTHKFVGVLTINYRGQTLYYAASSNDPVIACSKVFAVVLKQFGYYKGNKPDQFQAKLLRVHQKFFDGVFAA